MPTRSTRPARPRRPCDDAPAAPLLLPAARVVTRSRRAVTASTRSRALGRCFVKRPTRRSRRCLIPRRSADRLGSRHGRLIARRSARQLVRAAGDLVGHLLGPLESCRSPPRARPRRRPPHVALRCRTLRRDQRCAIREAQTARHLPVRLGMPLLIGYKASAASSTPNPARLTVEPTPWVRAGGRVRPLPALAPPRRPLAGGAALAGGRRPAHVEHGARHERPDPDAALPPVGDRAGVRDARLPLPRPHLPRGGHGRGAQRDAGHRGRVPGPQGAPAAPDGGD